MLNNGLATVSKVSERRQSGNEGTTEASADFGLAEAFSSLFKVGIGARRSSASNASEESSSEEERTHTPASLLYQVINECGRRGFIHPLSGPEVPPGTLVEFRARLTTSPLHRTMGSILRVGELALAVEGASKPEAHRSAPRGKGADKTTRSSPDHLTHQLLKQIKTIEDGITAGGTLDLLATPGSQGFEAIITVETSMLSDPTLSNLEDGTFTVFGKVINSLKDASESISLIRKSALSIAPEMVEGLIGAIQGMNEGGVFQTPDVRIRINGPAVHVLPIAIYS